MMGHAPLQRQPQFAPHHREGPHRSMLARYTGHPHTIFQEAR